MKVIGIIVVQMNGPQQSARIITSAMDLTHVGWFQRSSVQQVMLFTAKTVAERTDPGMRHVIDDVDFSAYIYRPSISDLAIVTVTDKSYPARAAHCIGPQVMSEFTAAFTPSDYSKTEISSWPYLTTRLAQVQSPDAAMDKIAKIQAELDSTTEIMHKNIEDALKRGERMDDLLAKTEELDLQTKMFVKSARKANRRCCSLQ